MNGGPMDRSIDVPGDRFDRFHQPQIARRTHLRSRRCCCGVSCHEPPSLSFKLVYWCTLPGVHPCQDTHSDDTGYIFIGLVHCNTAEAAANTRITSSRTSDVLVCTAPQCSLSAVECADQIETRRHGHNRCASSAPSPLPLEPQCERC